jgi:hypothetical protein
VLRIRIRIILKAGTHQNEEPNLEHHQSKTLDPDPHRGDADPQHWYRLPYPTDINYTANRKQCTDVISTASTKILRNQSFLYDQQLPFLG